MSVRIRRLLSTWMAVVFLVTAMPVNFFTLAEETPVQEQGAAQPSDSVAVPPEVPVEQNAAVESNEPLAVQNTPAPTAVPATTATT